MLLVFKTTTRKQKEKRIMKRVYPLALLLATGAMLVTSASLCASETDDRIAVPVASN
jgi:hypothetical protein